MPRSITSLHVAGLALLLPEDVDDADDVEQRGGADQQDALLVGVGPELGVGLQGHEEGRLDGDEHHDEVGRFKLGQAVIAGAGEAGDVGADAGEMELECGLAGVVGGGVHAVGVGVERDLGIDDEVAAAGEQEDHVGAHGAGALAGLGFGGEGLLEGVLLAFAEAGLVEQIAENEFAPVALRFGGAAQGGGQIAGVVGELLVHGVEAGDEGLELGDADGGFGLGLFDLLAELLDLGLERGEEGVEVLLAGFGEGLGFLVEDFGGEGLELVGEGLLGGFEEGDFFLQVLALVAEVGFKLADAGGEGALGVGFGVEGGGELVALGGEAVDGGLALGGEGFESGAALGEGADLGEFGGQSIGERAGLAGPFRRRRRCARIWRRAGAADSR